MQKVIDLIEEAIHVTVAGMIIINMFDGMLAVRLGNLLAIRSLIAEAMRTDSSHVTPSPLNIWDHNKPG